MIVENTRTLVVGQKVLVETSGTYFSTIHRGVVSSVLEDGFVLNLEPQSDGRKRWFKHNQRTDNTGHYRIRTLTEDC